MKTTFKNASPDFSMGLLADVAPFAILITPAITNDGFQISVQGDECCINTAQKIARFIGEQLVTNTNRPTQKAKRTKKS